VAAAEQVDAADAVADHPASEAKHCRRRGTGTRGPRGIPSEGSTRRLGAATGYDATGKLLDAYPNLRGSAGHRIRRCLDPRRQVSMSRSFGDGDVGRQPDDEVQLVEAVYAEQLVEMPTRSFMASLRL
jgi:hypothetical protein